MLAACLCVQAQTTTQILDRAAAVVGRSGGCSAAFTLSHPQTGKATGNIQIKGQKFHAVLGEMEVWFNGKTQWVYQASTEEVSISNPSAVGRQQMNPYTFISLYKRGYNAKHVSRAGYYIVTLTPQKNTKPTLGVITLTIRKKIACPRKYVSTKTDSLSPFVSTRCKQRTSQTACSNSIRRNILTQKLLISDE